MAVSTLTLMLGCKLSWWFKPYCWSLGLIHFVCRSDKFIEKAVQFAVDHGVTYMIDGKPLKSRRTPC